MTVDTTTRMQTYVATGDVLTVYTVPFQFYEIDVYVNGTIKTNGVHYTVVGGNGSTGSIKFTNGNAPPAGQTIAVVGAQSISQPVEYDDFDDAPSEVYEKTVDQLTMMIAEMNEKIGRSLRNIPFTAELAPLDFKNNPNSYLFIDGSGNPTFASVGAGGVVNFLQGGTGSVARTIQDKLRERISVEDFGTAHDGVTNDAAKIQAAIDYANSLGGGVVSFGPYIYAIAAELNVPRNVELLGQGSDHNHDIGTAFAQATTRLKWTGSAAGNMVLMQPATGASAQRLIGCGVRGISFDSNSGLAATGIKVRSLRGGEFEDLFGLEFSSAFIDLGVVTPLGENGSLQNCRFVNITSRNTVVSATGGLFILDGNTAASPSGANTSYNIFINCLGAVRDGIAFWLQNCDNNLFFGCRATVTGTGKGVQFEGSNSNVADVARVNIFFQYGNAAILAKGTASYTFPSFGNRFFCLDKENGTALPTIEAGSECFSDFSDAIGVFQGMVGLGIGDGTANARTARTNIGTRSLYVVNNSGTHIRLAKGDETLPWDINIDLATGRLRVVGGSGTDHFNLAPQTGKGYAYNGTQVVGPRVTGYTAFSGTNTNRGTAYDTATITLVQLAERVRALQVDLTAHGLIGP